MSAAAITPNVKGIVVCDEVFGSDVEANVFTLEGVRHEFVASSFPHDHTYWLFLHLESARAGTWNGNVRFIHNETAREARRVPLRLNFDQLEQNVGHAILVPNGRFPLPGLYNIEVWFWDQQGREVLKGERTFHLIEGEPHERGGPPETPW